MIIFANVLYMCWFAFIIVAFMIGFMVVMSWRLTLMSLFSLPLIALATSKYGSYYEVYGSLVTFEYTSICCR